jgi:hypothetical protein
LSEPTTISLPQDTDTPPRQDDTPLASLLLASRRSAEAIESDLSNEDYVTYRYDDQRLAFALCDGVGQSFFGELAARFLGEKLVDWLWALPDDAGDEVAKHAERLFNNLHKWTESATEIIKEHPLPKDKANSLRRKALERKRDAGSASVFACARIDAANREAGCVAFWLGNTQLRFWDARGQEVLIPEGHVHEEQWSTAKGPLNSDVVHHLALPNLADEGIRRLTAHTDGVHQFVDAVGGLTKSRLEKLMQELEDDPASDDVSLLDVKLK